MKYFALRICTEVVESAKGPEPENSSRPLEDFWSTDAYVLLGSPGAGKTEAFKEEAQREGNCYVTARNFNACNKSKWRDTTLFIDGLDEVRAGTTDGRTPFDRIREKLYALDCPRFRLSCREVDWFGANDRDHLKAVSHDGKVTVLRLDPLSENDIREILRLNFGIEDADGFVESAREKGIDGLLSNPQSLKMLVVAVAGGAWPETRLQTFDLACKTLLRDPNQEHLIANRDRFDISHLMDAAGRLCAVQLLTGSAGYTLHDGESDREFLGLETIPGNDRKILRHALGTRVFEAPSEGRAAPVHRQIAEFISARYLAALIDKGLPVGRVLALMTGHDGVPVSELRGLFAWLVAHSKTSRVDIIARDPLGTVLYGDVRGFSTDEKRRVLGCLEQEVKRNPGVVRTIQVDPRLGDLITPDMEEHFQEILADPVRDDAWQSFVLILIESLRYGQILPKLADLLMGIVRDATWWLRIRKSAFNAFVQNRGDAEKAFAACRCLLSDVRAGVVSDPDDDLLGYLLTELYPERLSVPEVLQYLRIPNGASYLGMYALFWTNKVPEKSTNAQLAELLDMISRQFNQLKSAFVGSPGRLNLLRLVPLRWLRRVLETSQENIPPDRLFNWLGVASDPELRPSAEDTTFIQDWLNCHPDVLKEIIRLCVEDCVGSENYNHCMYMVERRLFRAPWPPDFGSWCLSQAVDAEDCKTATWFIGKVADSVYHRRHDEDLSLEIVKRRLVGNLSLRNLFYERLADLPETDKQLEGLQEVGGTHDPQRQREWRERVKPHEAALRDNQCPPPLLHHLAKVYYGEFIDVEGNTPSDRLRDLLGSDEGLITAILEGFCGSIRRSDVPTDTEILDLRTRNQTHLLALPIMAGLEEIVQTAPTRELFLDETQIRLALAIHYSAPTPHGAEWPPNWFTQLLASHPSFVANVLIRSAGSKIRSGTDFVSGLHELLSEDHAAVAYWAALPLLKAFPVRCSKGQLPNLSILLQAALLHYEGTPILKLIDKKLAHRSMNVGQRVYWLAAGLLASPDLYLKRLESYVARNERRVRNLAAFLPDDDFSPRLVEGFDALVLRILIRLIGSSYRPYSHASQGAVRITPNIVASERIEGFINKLASIPSLVATKVLEELSSDDNLGPWRFHLDYAAYRQNVARREADFHQCDVEQVIAVLDNRKPANAADLAALAFEYLREISRNIRHGSTSDWHQYWNADPHNRPQGPKPEDACRDALLSDLKIRLQQLGIDAQKEGQYADNKRSDIRISYSSFNVPVEVKRSCHRNLWSAIKTQLVAKYTRDPSTDGYGIYLVFWFGDTERCQPTTGLGSRPGSAEELKQLLSGTLSTDERRKILICVIDVSKPQI